MIDHVQVLLLNLPSVVANNRISGFYVDPSFIPVKLTRDLEEVRSALFYGIDEQDVAGMASRVNSACRAVLTPENTLLSALGDSRLTVNRDLGFSDMFQFLSDMKGAEWDTGTVNRVLACSISGAIFSAPTGTQDDLVRFLSSMKSRWEDGVDMVRRFSAFLSAYVVRLEIIRRKTLAGG